MAQTDITYAYAADIIKSEKTDDGDLLVFGKAAGPEVDFDGQICDPAWLKSAMPAWGRWGNVRAQHSAIAAGVGVELEDVGGGSWTLKSLIVDEDSKRKVDKRVYKGYSIGVKNAHVVKDAKAPKGRIVAGDIVEISLVDRPANPTATMMLCKVAGGVPTPVDFDGELLEIDKAATGEGPLSPDLVKAALSTVDGVLHGDLIKALEDDGDIDGAETAIRQMARLIQSEAQELASSDLTEVVDITNLVKAARALECFMVNDDEGDGYDGMEDDVAAYQAAMEALLDRLMVKMAARTTPGELDNEGEHVQEGDTSKTVTPDAATLVEAEITKAVAKATGPLEAELKTLRAELAKAMAAPRTGGPYLITQGPSASVAKPTQADKFRAIAQQPHVTPEVAAAYRALAAEEEGANA